jgi:hypothetical protein
MADLAAVLEKDWQAEVIELSHIFGWYVAHFRPALTKHGWRTPVAADGEGYPDLSIVRERVIWLELKREKTHCTPAQIEWLRCLVAAGAEVYVPRPRNFDALGQVLAHRGRPDPSKNPYAAELIMELEKEMTR